MYAVIKTGGKQYKVREGDSLNIEKLPLDEGSTVDFDALMVGNDESVTVGKPIVEGAKVSATVEGHGRGKKIRIIKFRRRKHHMKQMGHRQHFTQVKITGIAV